jgi:hypothetical protein
MSITRRGFLDLAATPFALAAVPLLRAQMAAETRGREIVEKAIFALGGDGFRQMRTRTEVGRAYSFYREQITGLSIAHVYTRYLPEGKPIAEEQRQVFGKKLDDAVILTTSSAWEVNFRGARPLGDERLRSFIETTLHDVFYILRARLNEPGLTFEHKGKDVVENAPVETIEIYDSENRNVTAWIHSSTFLPVKQRFQRWDPAINDRREEITRYTKYRESGNGVMWPHDVQRERDQEKIFELYADKVTVGEDFKPGMFELPPGVTVLKK